MRIIADTHTHTNVIQHAFSTLLENIAYAKKAGLEALAMTEHGPALGDSASQWHLGSVAGSLPQYIEGIMVIKGVETNLLDDRGTLELPRELYSRMQWVIGSMHSPVLPTGRGADYYTAVWERYAAEPLIDCIGHCGCADYPFDHERTVKKFAEYGKAVEINNHSFTVRRGSAQNCLDIARLCKKYGVPVVVSSDAHIATQIGDYSAALAVLKEADFPEELVLNTDLDRLVDFINSKPEKKNKITRSE